MRASNIPAFHPSGTPQFQAALKPAVVHSTAVLPGENPPVRFASIPADTAKAYALSKPHFGKSKKLDPVLENFLKNAEKAKGWYYQATPEGVRIGCTLGNQNYEYSCPPIDGSEPAGSCPIRGRTFFVSPLQRKAPSDKKKYPVDADTGKTFLKALTDIVGPKVERQLGLDPNLDTTPVLMKFAEKLLKGTLSYWDEEGENDLNAVVPRFAMEILPGVPVCGVAGTSGKTDMILLQDAELGAMPEQVYMNLQRNDKKGGYSHVFRVQSDREYAALRMLVYARLILLEEARLKKAGQEPDLTPEAQTELDAQQADVVNIRAAMTKIIRQYKIDGTIPAIDEPVE